MLVTEFLTNLKARGQYQAAQTVLSDNDYIRMANDQMRMVICPKILSVRQNYFMGQKDYEISPSRRRYRLPNRILGNRINLVRVFSGSTTTDGYFDLNQTSIKQRHNGRQGFYVSQGDLILTGDVPTGILRIFYPIRPPKMVVTATALASCNGILSDRFTIDVSLPDGTYQVIRSGSPYRTITPAAQIVGTDGFDLDSPFEYDRFQPNLQGAIGDFVINVDSTPVVPLQEQLCDWLLQRTHMRVLAALGQVEELAAQGSKLRDIEQSCLALINPRVTDEPKIIPGMQSAGWGGY